MGKIFLLLVPIVVAFLSACSGYFAGEDSKNSKDGVNKLALSGGGYLSTDDYNEITPFLYRDGGKAWLFFASDRGGNYDIYYAEMDSEGKFNAPVKLDTNLNTTNHEYSPVVFQSYRNGDAPTGTNCFISFIRIEFGGASTNIRTFLVSNTFNVYSMGMGADPTMANAKSIALLSKTNHMPGLLISIDSTNLLQSTWNTNAFSTSPCWNSPSSMLIGSTTSVLGIDGYHIGTTSWTNIYIYDVLFEGKRTLFKGFVASAPATNFQQILEYASDFNDAQPCLDLITMKVYFSSDRYGKGNYDLYRYNTLTFDKAMH
jgi:hypothetical protein